MRAYSPRGPSSGSRVSLIFREVRQLSLAPGEHPRGLRVPERRQRPGAGAATGSTSSPTTSSSSPCSRRAAPRRYDWCACSRASCRAARGGEKRPSPISSPWSRFRRRARRRAARCWRSARDRDRIAAVGALLALDERGEPHGTARAIDLAPLYATLAAHVGSLNIEGAFCETDAASGSLVLLQRGAAGQRQRRDPVRPGRRDDLARADSERRHRTRPHRRLRSRRGRRRRVRLHRWRGAPDGAWLFSAVAEQSDNSYDDGACRGAGARHRRPRRHAARAARAVADAQGRRRRGERRRRHAAGRAWSPTPTIRSARRCSVRRRCRSGGERSAPKRANDQSAARIPINQGLILNVSSPDATVGSAAATAASSSAPTPAAATIMPPPSSSRKGPPSASLPFFSSSR